MSMISMELIEGLILLSVAGVGGMMWYGVRRIVTMNDHTLQAVIAIDKHLALINGRLGKSETWMEMHREQDTQQFTHAEESIRRLWERIENPRS